MDTNEVGTGLQLSQDVIPAIQQVGNELGVTAGVRDKLGAWVDRQHISRVEKAAVAMTSAVQRLRERNVPATAVSDPTMARLLAGAVDNEFDGLNGAWVELIAGALSGASVPPAITEILRQLEPAEAQLLEEVFLDQMTIAPAIREQFSFGLNETRLGLEKEEIAFHVDNLMRLGLIRAPGNFGGVSFDAVTLTTLGERFIRICRPADAPLPEVVWNDSEALQAHIAANSPAL